MEDLQDPRRRNPRALENVVNNAAQIYCSICNSNPCYLMSTVAMAVLQEQLNVENNLIGALRYRQALEHLQSCVIRHMEVLKDEFSLDEHFRVTPMALEALEEDGVNIAKLTEGIAKEQQPEGLPEQEG